MPPIVWIIVGAFVLYFGWTHIETANNRGAMITEMCLYETDMASAFGVSDKQWFCDCIGKGVQRNVSFTAALLQNEGAYDKGFRKSGFHCKNLATYGRSK